MWCRGCGKSFVVSCVQFLGVHLIILSGSGGGGVAFLGEKAAQISQKWHTKINSYENVYSANDQIR